MGLTKNMIMVKMMNIRRRQTSLHATTYWQC